MRGAAMEPAQRRLWLWGSLGVAILVALATSIIGPSVVGAREDARNVRCLTNACHIVKAVLAYQDRYGEPPARPDLLVAVGLLKPEELRCPGDRSEQVCSYTLVPGLVRATDSERLLVYESVERHGGRRWVAFAGGTARRVRPPEFARLLARVSTQPAAAADANSPMRP